MSTFVCQSCAEQHARGMSFCTGCGKALDHCSACGRSDYYGIMYDGNIGCSFCGGYGWQCTEDNAPCGNCEACSHNAPVADTDAVADAYHAAVDATEQARDAFSACHIDQADAVLAAYQDAQSAEAIAFARYNDACSPDATPKLTYSHCDDWMIYARASNGDLYYVITELWSEWLDVSERNRRRADAVERYMLPIAIQRWNSLGWIKAAQD